MVQITFDNQIKIYIDNQSFIKKTIDKFIILPLKSIFNIF